MRFTASIQDGGGSMSLAARIGLLAGGVVLGAVATLAAVALSSRPPAEPARNVAASVSPVVSTALPPAEADYWTDERMRNAVPAGPRTSYRSVVVAVSGAVLGGLAVVLAAVLFKKRLRRSVG
ncbi:hypothetical protein IU422_24965 [Nocardia farcinica]|nr:hypothetical protein [Nocardia farcinica]